MFDLIGFDKFNDDLDFGLDDSPAVFPVGTRDIAAVGKDGKHLAMPNHKATIGYRNGNVVPLGVVGDGYQLMPNRDYYGVIEQALRGSIRPDLLAGHQVRTQLAGDGAWSRREYVFPAFAEALRNTEFQTKFGLRVIAWNSYDGSASAGIAVGLIDFYCTNGMIVGKSIDQGKRRHTTNFTPDYFVPLITRNLANLQKQVRELEAMMHTPLRPDDAENVLKHHFSEARAKRLLERVHVEADARGMNVFALHSALTFYASHNSEQFGVRRTGNDNVARTLQGREEEVRRVVQAADFQRLIAA